MTTFLDVVELLLTDADAKDAYASNPGEFLNEHGLGSLSSADVADAMRYAGDALPLPVATQLSPEEGLDSAAALDLESEGLSLEREAYDAVEDTDLDDSGLGEDVDFDSPQDEAAGGADTDAVDLFDASSAGGSEVDSAAGAVDPTESIAAATDADALDQEPAQVDDFADEQPAVSEPSTELDDLTDFIPTEDAVIETSEARLDDDAEELDFTDLTDTAADDLDFLD